MCSRTLSSASQCLAASGRPPAAYHCTTANLISGQQQHEGRQVIDQSTGYSSMQHKLQYQDRGVQQRPCWKVLNSRWRASIPLAGSRPGQIMTSDQTHEYSCHPADIDTRSVHACIAYVLMQTEIFAVAKLAESYVRDDREQPAASQVSTCSSFRGHGLSDGAPGIPHPG